MKNSLKNLLKIKSIVTIVVLAVFVYGVVTGMLKGENIMTITSVVITFYFATKGGSLDGSSGTDSKLSDKSAWDYSDGLIN